MILKISLYNGWHYISKVENFQISDTDFSKLKQDEQEGVQEAYLLYDTGRREDRTLKLLRINIGLFNFERIVLDVNQVYLMSDEGKTIERIN